MLTFPNVNKVFAVMDTLPVCTYHPLKPGEIHVFVPNSADGFSWALRTCRITALDFDRDGEERYRFVGDAYVHGLMHGEVLEMGVEEKKMVFV